MTWLVFIVGVPVAIYALRELVIALSCRGDDGRVVYAHLRELLLTSDKWKLHRPSTLQMLWRGPGGFTIRLHWYRGNLEAIEAHGRRLTPGFGWRKRIMSALNRMKSDKARADKLNAICDIIEGMESKA